ncbi:MAG: DUF192 domain-containing protein [Paracoccaceae bacterium]
MFALAFAGEAAGFECRRDRVLVLAETGEVVYEVEIADDPQERERGLMFRQSLAPEAGMLFLFDAPRRAGFWMRNTFVSLDIVFLAEDGRVLNVAADAVPFSEEMLLSDGEAAAVLEVNAGEAARHGIGPGTQVVHPFFEAEVVARRCA